ncbi:MAG TPA: WecB/TagA/CpsF family glycosyltransferase [Patescibacteria group bacterium]
MKNKITHIRQNSKNNPNINKSYSFREDLVKKEVFGVGITYASKNEILEYIVDFIKNTDKNCYITTPNPEMIVYAKDHEDFKAILNNSEIALLDGAGLSIGARVVGKGLKERFTGVELVQKLCEKVSNQPITVGFLGGRDGVAEKTANCLQKMHPMLKVSFVGEEWEEFGFRSVANYMGPNSSDQTRKEGRIQNTKYKILNTIDILFIAFGFPKQEEWMAKHLNKIPVRVMVGVGGAFDYLSGKVPRAPYWVQNIGMEWAFRLVLQPWRFRRQLALPKFLWMVIRERLK